MQCACVQCAVCSVQCACVQCEVCMCAGVCAVLSGRLRDGRRTIKMNEGSKTDDGY